NFTINKRIVFKKSGGTISSLGKYITLTAANYVVSSFIVSTVHVLTNIVATPIKIVVDSLLWIVTYTLQRVWVFKKSGDNE
ncbi:MAG: GtrA family protein, partial [Clostridia bacterium]|nr:GtrA family protein [Clostridia bacterium]